MFFQFRQLRVAVNVPDWDALHQEVTQRFRRGQGFALATINLDHLVKLRGSETFRRAYAAQDYVTADGNPIVWMSRLAGDPVDLIPGADAILPVVRIAAQEGVTLALVGSQADTLCTTAAYLEREVPGANVVLQIAPPMGFDPEGTMAQDILRQIGDSGARLCLVALGAPKQEQFAAAGRTICPQVGFLSIGAGLDFFAGTQKRAPGWVRKLALEWLWRALSSPMRLGPRYIKCLAILPGHMLRALGQRLTRT